MRAGMKQSILYFLFISKLILTSFGFNMEDEFNTWLKQHKKIYVSKQHRSAAFNNFKKNQILIQNHNLRYELGKTSFEMGHNLFSDVSEFEFKQHLKPFNLQNRPVIRSDVVSIKSIQVPDNWTASELNLNTDLIPVKHQQDCFSCWAFSAIGVLEYKLLNKTNQYFDLSEQNCVDCAVTDGCTNGYVTECFEYLVSNGVNYETKYPYVNRNETCRYKNQTNSISPKQVGAYRTIPGDEKLMSYIMSKFGWISASINADLFRFYKGGVIEAAECDTNPNHAVILVGYGRENQSGLDYWIGRNFWGPYWGEGGHFRIERGQNACDIAHYFELYRAYLE